MTKMRTTLVGAWALLAIGVTFVVPAPASAATCEDYSSDRFGFPTQTLQGIYGFVEQTYNDPPVNEPIGPFPAAVKSAMVTSTVVLGSVTVASTTVRSALSTATGGTVNPGPGPDDEDGFVVAPSRDGDVTTETSTVATIPTVGTSGVAPGESVYVQHPNVGTVTVSIAATETLGVSSYVHNFGVEFVEGGLAPGTRPIHFVNCNVVVPIEDEVPPGS